MVHSNESILAASALLDDLIFLKFVAFMLFQTTLIWTFLRTENTTQTVLILFLYYKNHKILLVWLMSAWIYPG